MSFETASDNPPLTNEDLEESARIRNRLRRVHWLLEFICCRSPIRTGSIIDRAIAAATTALLGDRFGPYPSMARAISRAIASKTLPPLNGRIQCPTRIGVEMCVSKESGINYYRFGFYESATLSLMRKILKPGDVFIDVGASVGQMTLLAAKLVGESGRVLAVEALSTRFELLQAGVKLNGFQNIVCYNGALGSIPEKRTLFTDRGSPSFIPLDEGEASGISVEVTTLDRLVSEFGLTGISMLKIDVEGFELEVLRGAREVLSGERPPVLCFEYGVYERSHGILEFILSLNPGYAFYFSKYGNADAKPRLVKVGNEHEIPAGFNVFAFPAHFLRKMELKEVKS